ncbi:MAG: hypothetical protein QXD66_02335 [Candidatus Nezhaarchaeales archaeon]|nr:MAG: hypothetical protein DSO05_04855 [Candidatus Nezhaarchaeota archaeon WYZ-LMO7]TDA36325.1 MAG: hypothetical protein DSO06_00380 [Candidatus Nezhaarchaeota archaeon WYZ-LMO8]
MKEGLDLVKIRRELRGEALRLFFYLNKRISGYTIEEIRYFSGFSNKAVINRCLTELRRLGVVDKQGDKYYVPRLIAEAVNFIFKHYAKIGNRIIARGFLGAIAYLVFLLILIAMYPQALMLLPLGLIFTSIFVVIGLYQSHRLKRLIRELKRLK